MQMTTGMQRGESTAVVMVVQGAAVGPVFARRRCRTEPASSHSERRSSSSLAPPPAKQVPGSSSMLMATRMPWGEIRAAVMVVQGAASNTGGSGTRLSEMLKPRLRLTMRAYDIVLCEKKIAEHQGSET